MSGTSFWNRPFKPKIILSWKIVCLTKWCQKNQVKRRNIFTEKNALFLKSINNILKRYQWNFHHNCYQRTLELWGQENAAYLFKKLKSFNAAWLIMNYSFSYQRNFFLTILLGIRRKHSAYPVSEIFFSSS